MNPVLKAAKSLVPPALGARLHRLFDDEGRAARDADDRRAPRTALEPSHVAPCTVLVDREALLAHLPHGGVVAEVGVDHGAFSQRILEATRPSHLHLIDVWGSERYHDGLFELVTDTFRPQTEAGEATIHRALSVDAAARFPASTFDWVYLDTDHSYETTRDELRAYAPLVKPEGLIAGHDYVMGNWGSGYRYGVMEAVHEFCAAEGWALRYVTASLTEKASFAIQRLR